ncbi:CerR family C-terminal domain-containing protein [Acuticoccus mangrovi]|uniref:CerR family C-terminal domain-containing protein n=1 Tax=Acuticoccus mangrovi TaxID=2796142 RepID=A0A934ILJ4_9HYPH|nr:CerR family C-terminal domain-containing protein [Acuticoccus mangrovi]MBJ3774860.1 CerR family C-terminal domain-containing protein [Acuticoccus mangrovi]
MQIEPAEPSRADATREKLLAAAVEVFGLEGFDGATTRRIADAASVNLQAISYYFGSKEGLFLAAADHVVASILAEVSEERDAVRSRLAALDAAGEPLSEAEARALLTQLLTVFAHLFLSPRSEPWARFVMREQMQPGDAFVRIYQGIMAPTLAVAHRLLGAILGEPPKSTTVRLRAMSLLGSVLVFRVAHSTVLAEMGWDGIDDAAIATVTELAETLVAEISPATRRSST